MIHSLTRSQQNVKAIQMQNRLEGTKGADDFSLSLFARADSTKPRSRLSPLREVTSKKFGAIERLYLETVGLLILPKSRPPLFETSPSVGQGFARNSPVRVWPSWPCQERRDRIDDDEGKRDEDRGARTEGEGGGRKKPGPKGARERNAWELNHVVGRLAREISRCESARTRTHTYT